MSVKNINQNLEFLSKAEREFELGNLTNAKLLFIEESKFPQAAFMEVLLGNLDEAKRLYMKADTSPSRQWGLFLCEFFKPSLENEQILRAPSYLTFRLFSESSIYYFIKHNLSDYIDLLLKNKEKLAQCYPDFLKSFASAFLAHGQYEASIRLLEAYKKYQSKDPELYFKLAENFMLSGDPEKAITLFQKTLDLLPGHIASQEYVKQLSKKIG